MLVIIMTGCRCRRQAHVNRTLNPKPQTDRPRSFSQCQNTQRQIVSNPEQAAAAQKFQIPIILIITVIVIVITINSIVIIVLAIVIVILVISIIAIAVDIRMRITEGDHR